MRTTRSLLSQASPSARGRAADTRLRRASCRRRTAAVRSGRAGSPGSARGAPRRAYRCLTPLGVRHRVRPAARSGTAPLRRCSPPSPCLRVPPRPRGRSRARARRPASRARSRLGRSGRRSRGRSSSAIPGPWSATITSPSRTDTSIGAPGGLYLTALSSRLPTARSTSTGSTLTCTGVSDVTNIASGARAFARSTALKTRSSS